MKRSTKVLLGVVVAALVVFVVAPWVYINLIRDDAPDRLTLASTETTIDVATDETTAVESGDDEPFDPSGEWVITDKSVVGYRVEEVLFGQNVTAVGRTESVTGSIVIDAESVNEGGFTVDMATITSDSSRRDGQVNGRILQTATYPQATFALSAPIALPLEAFEGQPTRVDATGTLTLLDVTREVTFPVDVQLVDGSVNIVGTITIVFDEWNIPDPSTGGISVEPQGELEFSLVLAKNG
jgi:polyisoprenoid-binding protein YceI